MMIFPGASLWTIPVETNDGSLMLSNTGLEELRTLYIHTICKDACDLQTLTLSDPVSSNYG